MKSTLYGCSLVLLSILVAAGSAAAQSLKAQRAAEAEELELLEELFINNMFALDALPLDAQQHGQLTTDSQGYTWCQVGDTYYNCRYYDCSTCGTGGPVVMAPSAGRSC